MSDDTNNDVIEKWKAFIEDSQRKGGLLAKNSTYNIAIFQQVDSGFDPKPLRQYIENKIKKTKKTHTNNFVPKKRIDDDAAIEALKTKFIEYFGKENEDFFATMLNTVEQIFSRYPEKALLLLEFSINELASSEKTTSTLSNLYINKAISSLKTSRDFNTLMREKNSFGQEK